MKLIDRMITGFFVGATVFAAPLTCAMITLDVLSDNGMVRVFNATMVFAATILVASTMAGVAYYFVIDKKEIE